MAQLEHSEQTNIDSGKSDFAVLAEDFSFTYAQSEENTSQSDVLSSTIGPLNWQVRTGSFQLMIGATGSGKTTLLRNIVPALAPAGEKTGDISVFGHGICDLDIAQAGELVGYVAQSPENQIVCDSVWHELAFELENLGIPQEEMHRRVAEVAHFFGIEPWFRRDVSTLSGGQKQIVALASVMAARPRLLLLDEPTAQLDPVAETNFLHALFRINRELGVTVVVATHAPETMTAYATDAVEIANGCIQEVDLEAFARRPLDVSGARHDSNVPTNEPSQDIAIEIKDVYARYQREDDWVLRGCDLSVDRGHISALVGGNGAGKSTLLRVIAQTMKTQRGRVYNQFVQHQAFLPQDPKALFVCDTAEEELREWQSACGYSDEDFDDTLGRFGLTKVLHQHPYDLSGGQQQMLALAKLLLTKPDLLLLDEPTKGLDARFQFEVARVITELRDEGVTVVIASHDLSFAALVADEISMLFDGAITCCDPAPEFFTDNLFYRPIENAFTRLWSQRCAGKDILENE